jgi:1-acyl-sn-glycerol-3-phosphate acyltransferase
MHVFFWAYFRMAYRLRVIGLDHVPATGGVILAANHASFLDPPILAVAVCHRPIRFMARDDLLRVPVVGQAMRKLGALPIRRGGANGHALRNFVSLIRDQGEMVLIFPEGTRSADGTLKGARRGIGAICLAAQEDGESAAVGGVRVPVVPALISGAFRVWPRSRRFPRPWGRIEVRFGPPVQWSNAEINATGDANGALATLIMKRIAELKTAPGTPVGFWKGYRRIFRQPSTGGKPVIARVPDAHGDDTRVRSC